MPLPFAHLNLRRNPFGTVPRDERAQVAVVDVDRWCERVRAGEVVEIVGPAGRGKTTRLLAIADSLSAVPYVRVEEEGPGLEGTVGGVCCVDEAHRLSGRRRRALYRRAEGLALGTHASMAGEIEAVGRAVTTVRLDGSGVDAAFVRRLVEKRLAWARRGAGAVPQVGLSAIEELLARYEDNVRAMVHHLYEVFQQLDTARTVEAGDLAAAPAPPPGIADPEPPPSGEVSIKTTIRRLLNEFTGA